MMLSSVGISLLAGAIVGFSFNVWFLILLIVVVSTCIVVIGPLDGVSIYSLLVTVIVFNMAFQAGYLSGVLLSGVKSQLLSASNPQSARFSRLEATVERHDARECRRAIQTTIAQGLQEQIAVPWELPHQMVVLLLQLDQHRDHSSARNRW
jgi:hypothetical protein